MPDSKDTGEKPWPEVELYRGSGTLSFVRSLGDDSECYLPLRVIRERLTDRQTVRVATTAALALPDDGSEDFDAVTLVAIEAALDAAFSKEEGSDG